jgi:AcrR family transcriptional regulator
MSKKQAKVDPRVLRTRQFLQDALISLIKEKGFDNVQIQEITDRAGLNRSTFYLHYRDKNDLLVKNMGYTLEQLDQTVDVPSTVDDSQLTIDMMVNPLISAFDHFAEQADFYHIMLSEIGVPSVINEMQQYIEQVALRWLTELQPTKEHLVVDTDMIIKFVSTACIGVVKWWLNNGMPYSSEKMARQLMYLVSLGVFQAAGIELPSSADGTLPE